MVPDLNIGGAEQHLATLLPRLDRDRFLASTVCIGQPGDLFSTILAADLPAVALRRTKVQFLVALVELVVLLRRSRPDMMIARGYNAEMLGRIAAVLAGVPVRVVWVHNSGGLEAHGWLRRAADKVLEPFTTAYFGVAHDQVSYLAEELGRPASKIRIVPNGVDLARFDLSIQQRDSDLVGVDDLVIGIVAGLRPEKDHATLLRAARLVIDALPDARVLVAGDGALRTELTELAVDLGIAERVVFAGQRTDVERLLAMMDVFTLCSTSECSPLAVIEAMAAGLPVVCTSVGGLPELVEDGVTGHLVPPSDPSALADRLIEVLSDLGSARAMGKAARARVEQSHTLEKSIRAAESAIEEAAGRSPAGLPSAPLRLSFVLDSAGVGGAEVFYLNLLRHFDPKVVEPTLVCLKDAGSLGEEFRAAGLPIQVLGRGGRFDLRTVPRLVRSYRRVGTDAVLVTHHHRASLMLARVAAWIARVPANVVAPQGFSLNGERCLPRYAVDSLFLSGALVVTAPSHGTYLETEEGVGRYPWRRVRQVVIPNGITVAPLPTAADRSDVRAELGLGEEHVVVGIVARLSAEKAHDVLLRAVARLQPSHPLIRLVVVGAGPRASELHSLADELDIADVVRFTSLRRDVPRLLAAFDIAALCSRFECQPVAVIEAMGAGLPVAATDCGTLRDTVADGEEGFIVPVGDHKAMAQRIATLADDHLLRARLGAAARARVEREYDIVGTARRYENLLRTLVGSR